VKSRPSTIVLVVPSEARGARLDRFLTLALTSIPDAPSRAELQRWIEHGRVTVDGAIKKAADKLREGAQVVVDPEPPPRTEAIAEEGIDFDVLHVDASLVVLNKPPGLVVHPAHGHASGTLVNGLLARGMFDVSEAEEDDMDIPPVSFRSEAVAAGTESKLRPGIVHRLDKGTSGVMVVARTRQAREHLKRQFADHSIDREYEAICVGDVKAQIFDTLHGRHKTDRLKFTTKVVDGKRAVTQVTPLESLAHKSATHVLCRLETGRTHQIRVHLSEARTPILGDPLYGSPPKSPALKSVANILSHQALHARLLGFVHPVTQKAMRFTADPPSDFKLALEQLRAIP